MAKRFCILVGLGILLALVLSGALAADKAFASTNITVTTTQDVLNGNDGACSLREAVIAANTDAASGGAAGECPAGSGADTINLPAGVFTLTIAGDDDDLSLTSDLDLYTSIALIGSGIGKTVIDGNQIDRVFHILVGGSISISNLTVQNGKALLSQHTSLSRPGGGIANYGVLTLTQVALMRNFATGTGGGIYNAVNSQLIGVTVTVEAGHADLGTGGITNVGRLLMVGSVISGNSGAVGGLANGSNAVSQLERSFIFSNTAYLYGGGIYNPEASVITVTASTLANNTSAFGAYGNTDGGAIYTSGNLTLINSTVSNNKALNTDGDGGGIYVLNGMLTLASSTVYSNSTSSGQGGGIHVAGGVLKLQNSIVAGSGSSGGDCRSSGGVVTDNGNNIIQDNGCGFMGGVNPWLGPLQANGGPTLTHALLPGSPAINAGNPQGCFDSLGNLLVFDQRGASRIQGLRCDIGAYEYDLLLPLKLFLPLIRR